MAPLDKIEVELTVLIGEAQLPLRQLLNKGRGAIIPLQRGDSEPVAVLANGRKISEGRVILQGEEVAVELTGEKQRAA